MTKQIVVTDSTSGLSKEYLEADNIHVIPLSLAIEGVSHAGQVDTTSEELINHVENDEDIKTSRPAIGEFMPVYEELGKDSSEIIGIHFSSGLSGTLDTICQANQVVDANVTVIDSRSISFGLECQIQHLVEFVKEGVSTSEIIKKLNHLKEDIKLFVVIG